MSEISFLVDLLMDLKAFRHSEVERSIGGVLSREFIRSLSETQKWLNIPKGAFVQNLK